MRDISKRERRRRAEAIDRLTMALDCIGSSIRSIAWGIELNDRRTMETADWAVGALSEFYRIATGATLTLERAAEGNAAAVELQREAGTHSEPPALQVVGGTGV